MAEVPPHPSASPAASSVPTERITRIEDSLRCLAYGWLSLVPWTGVFFILPAVRLFRSVDLKRAEWNPAAHLWLRGLVLACFGFWASLLWWGGLAVAAVDAPEGDRLGILVYLLLFGSAPVLFGLGLAASRCPNRFGAFVQRCRRMLFGLLLLAYAVLAQVLVLYEPFPLKWPFNLRFLPQHSLDWLLGVWQVWLLSGFVCLAWRGIKSWWWLAWLAGAALLTAWDSAN